MTYVTMKAPRASRPLIKARFTGPLVLDVQCELAHKEEQQQLESMANQKVKLVGFWVSPFVYRVIWALKFKGVDYEYIEEDIFNKSALLLELNPVHKKVPVLIHEENAIAESFVILEYIDEMWKENPLLPNDPYDRAMARFWARFSEEKFLENACMAHCSEEEEDREKFVKLAIECLEKIEEELKRKKNKFLGGETIGYLDIVMGWIPYWLPMWEEVGSIEILNPLKFPATTSWINNMLSHPLIRENLPPRDKSVVYFQKRRIEAMPPVSLLLESDMGTKIEGVEYEYIEENVFNKSPLLLELNPVLKRVPVLVHEEKVINESFVILEYIDETWKENPLLPSDPYERAVARFWARFCDEKIMQDSFTAMCSEGEDQEKSVELTIESLEKLEEELKRKNKKFFAGETIGYLDISIGWISYWLPIWEEVGSMKILDPLKFPAITSWMNNFLSHPLIKENLLPRDKMVVYFKNRRKEIAQNKKSKQQS
ncbi:Glutathione S-transferase, C-terminal [Dillenia turbinata]|uniref:glutathione transferase n=1 Tax=Dillenia turbinata TaxID=194707 RepID=A0AAN8VDR9_9MAGN